MFTHPFFLYAFLTGTAIAASCGLIGYFLVLRAQVFTGDVLSHVAFTGALAALAFGIDLRVGLFTATIAVALGIGVFGRRGRADDVVIGNVFAWVLGLGVFFLTLYTTSRSGGNGTGGISVLFGSIFSLSAAQAWTGVAISGGTGLALLAIARPLLFASLDEGVASARGIPVRALGLLFLALVGATAAQATQAVGALLLLGLLAAPAGTALAVTDRPYRGLALSAALATVELWTGLLLSYALPTLPPSFTIIAVAGALHSAALLIRRPCHAKRTLAAP